MFLRKKVKKMVFYTALPKRKWKEKADFAKMRNLPLYLVLPAQSLDDSNDFRLGSVDGGEGGIFR